MKALIISILLFLSTLVYSQSNYRSGYIINLEGDTLNGLIDFRGDIRNSKICSFKTPDDVVTVYYPGQIHSYRFTDGKYYKSTYVQHPQENAKLIFAEYLVNGEKDLFYYRSEKDNHYLITYNDSTLIPIPYRKNIAYRDGKYYSAKSAQHIGFLKAYFKNAPELEKQINRIQHLSNKNLINLTESYHNLKCNDTECIVYAKTKPKFKMAVEPVLGYYKHKAFSDYKPQYGAHLYFWLPLDNENLYFKTGLLYTANTRLIHNTKYRFITIINKTDFKYYTIPLLLNYQLPYKTFIPKFDIGANLHLINNEYESKESSLSLTAGAGFLIKITSFFYFNAEMTTDIAGFSSDSDLIKGIGYRTGLYFTL